MIRFLYQNKDRKLLTGVITILIALSMALSACAPAATTPEISMPTPAAEATATETTPPTQAPTEPPSAKATTEMVMDSIQVSDQAIINNQAKISEADIDGVGWLAIHADADGKPGAIIGIAQLQGGTNKDVLVTIDTSKATDTLYAMLHRDTGYSGMWDSTEDKPVIVDGNPVMAAFKITGGLAGDPTPTTEVASGEVTIKIADSSFTPNKITIKVGTKVTWVHEGKRYHTVTADDGSFKSGDLANGEAFSYTFTKTGVYAYYCEIHGGPGGRGMSGVVEVIE